MDGSSTNYYDYSDYTCNNCGPIKNSEVNTQETSVLWVYEFKCNQCGGKVEE